MQVFLKIWRAAPIATALLGLASAAIIYFAVNSLALWLYWNDPAHLNQDIRGWMTPGYIAHSWDVPVPVVREAIGLSRDEGRIGAIERYAELRDLDLNEVILNIETAIEAHLDARGEDQ